MCDFRVGQNGQGCPIVYIFRIFWTRLPPESICVTYLFCKDVRLITLYQQFCRVSVDRFDTRGGAKNTAAPLLSARVMISTSYWIRKSSNCEKRWRTRWLYFQFWKICFVNLCLMCASGACCAWTLFHNLKEWNTMVFPFRVGKGTKAPRGWVNCAIHRHI